jgi:hypothetical protein
MASMQSAQPNRLVLLAPSRDDREQKIRRYRLARLKLDEQRDEREAPFAHLKRVYD